MHRIILLHAAAPPKPAAGAPCNGCGVCCTLAPCPLGVLVSRRTSGPCAALDWNEEQRRYRCGLVETPEAHLPRRWRRLAPVVGRAARRSISAGSGCDCDWHPQHGPASASASASAAAASDRHGG